MGRFTKPFAGPRSREWRNARARRAFTLVELMISLSVLVLTSVGGVSAFMLLNRYASNLRNLSAAKALCQERIEQAQTMTFDPLKNTPSVPGQVVNGTASGPFNLLGLPNSASSPNYDSSGKLTSASIQTSSEPVNVYLQQESGTNVVLGTRTTTIGLATGLNDVDSASTSLKVVQFTVKVSYTFRGQDYSYSMYTLRSPD